VQSSDFSSPSEQALHKAFLRNLAERILLGRSLSGYTQSDRDDAIEWLAQKVGLDVGEDQMEQDRRRAPFFDEVARWRSINPTRSIRIPC
jgi:hypothetical protein